MSVQTKLLDAKHSEYSASVETWNRLDLLYRGGDAIRVASEMFLRRRERELAEVYALRQEHFNYDNKFGAAMGWYQSALFRQAPDILFRRGTEDVSGADGEFFENFTANCNRGGVSLVSLFRDVWRSAVLFGSAYVLTDLPRFDAAQFRSRADQMAAGALDPFLVVYDPRQVINWETDSYGNFEWVTVAVESTKREFLREPVVVRRWYNFDRQTVRVYEAAKPNTPGDYGKDVAELVYEGAHALSSVGRVPIRKVSVPSDLHFGDRVYLPLLSYVNLDNAYRWGLHNGCLALFYVKGANQADLTRSEIGYLDLPPDAEAGYIEPTGVAWERAAAELASLREEIYRLMYLQAQSRTENATAASQSGLSKQQDMAPAHDVLAGFGEIIRGGMTAVLSDVCAARGLRDVEVTVAGLEFHDEDPQADIDTAAALEALNVPSDRLRREVQKRIAARVLPGALPETLTEIRQEIDAAPTREEQEAAEREREAEAMAGKLAGMSRIGGGKTK